MKMIFNGHCQRLYCTSYARTGLSDYYVYSVYSCAVDHMVNI